LDEKDLSPFCGVRSDEILPAFADHLDQIDVRTVGAFVTPLLRSHASQEHALSPWRTDNWLLKQPTWSFVLGVARHRFPRIFGRNASHAEMLNPEFMQELFLLSDVLTDLGLVKPHSAFATYKKA
jgi:hypothetical protein